LLSPYLKGYIENPAYYFNKNNLKKNEHIDLLLLTQGWTQYSLEEMISNLNPSYKYEFELGFKLKGTVFPLFTNHLALITPDNTIIDKVYLNGKKDFIFKNLLIYKGDSVKVSFVNSVNEAIKPENLHFDPVNTTPPTRYAIETLTAKKKIENLKNTLWDDLYFSGSIKLDEITVIKKHKNQSYYTKKKLVKKYESLVFDIGKYYPLKISDRYKNDNLISFLNSDQKVRLVKLNGMENYLAVGANKEAVLFIDGRRMASDELSSLSLRISDIENIMAQPLKGNMIYQIFTTQNYKKNIPELFNEYAFTDGFDKEKKYYSPVYDFNVNKHLNWGEIDWKPNLTTNTSGETFVKIKPHSESDGILFSIQGFSDEGFLISEIITEN